jgi:hypothetical protein
MGCRLRVRLPGDPGILTDTRSAESFEPAGIDSIQTLFYWIALAWKRHVVFGAFTYGKKVQTTGHGAQNTVL